MLRNEDLERDIARHPERWDAYRVYGDWLVERGARRGALMLACARRHDLEQQGASTDAISLAHAEERRLHVEAWEETLAQIESTAGLTVSWHRGVVRSAHFETGRGDSHDLLERWLRHPAFAVVQHLVVRMDLGQRVCQPIVDQLVDACPPSLRELTIGHQGPKMGPLGDLSAVWPRVPQLRSVDLIGVAARTSAPQGLSSLEELALTTAGTPLAWLDRVLDETWLALRTLVVSCADPDALHQRIEARRHCFPLLEQVEVGDSFIALTE